MNMENEKYECANCGYTSDGKFSGKMWIFDNCSNPTKYMSFL
jgi:ribosomal protein L37AE/L43A